MCLLRVQVSQEMYILMGGLGLINPCLCGQDSQTILSSSLAILAAFNL